MQAWDPRETEEGAGPLAAGGTRCTQLSTHLSTSSTLAPAIHPRPPTCPFPVLGCDPTAKRGWGTGGPVVRSGPTCSPSPTGLLALPHKRLHSKTLTQLGAQPLLQKVTFCVRC